MKTQNIFIIAKKSFKTVSFMAALFFLFSKFSYSQFVAESFFNYEASLYLVGDASTKASFHKEINNDIKIFTMFNEKLLLMIPFYKGNQIDPAGWFHLESPPEISIVDVTQKSNISNYYFVLFSNGETIVVVYNPLNNTFTKNYVAQITSPLSYLIVKKIIGDALYVVGNSTVYVSRNDGQTWEIDSAGLGQNNYVYDIAEDSSHYVYAATNKGLYKQHPDSSVWHIISSFPAFSSQVIFIDRRGRIYVSDYLSNYISTDKGTTWKEFQNIPQSNYVESYGDDVYGNIYAVTYYGAYRSNGGTEAWIDISQGISALDYAANPTNQFSNVQGDSIIYAATKYGNFQSTDFGYTWTMMHKEFQFKPNRLYSLARAGSYHFISTNLGIYRIMDGDTVFKKIFPVNGYFSNLSMQQDGTGNIYVVAPKGKNESSSTIWKSSDKGTAWILDTAGLKTNNITLSGNDKYYVDNNGNQYLFSFTKHLPYFRTKDTGWKVDSTGLKLTVSYDKPNRYLSDGVTAYFLKNEFQFPGEKLFIYKKTLPDGIWKIDSSGLSKYFIQDIIMDNDSLLYVFATAQNKLKLFKKTANQLIELPLPKFPLTPDIYFQNYYAFDSKNNLWLSVFDATDPFYQPRGLYFTKNDGLLWTYAGMDSIGINKLVAIADTVYALSFIDGLFDFRISQFTSIEDEIVNNQIPTQFQLYQNYPNPFNPTTTISFVIPKQSLVTIKIFDILGREIVTLLNEEKKEGFYSVPFNGVKLSSGVYFYRMQAGNFMQTKKLLLQK